MHTHRFPPASRTTLQLAGVSALLALTTACGGGGDPPPGPSPAPKAWQGAVPIEAETGYAEPPQLAYAANGLGVAVWAQVDGTRYDIWANHYNASTGTWGTARLIETNDTGPATEPQVAVDSSGNAVAVWSHYDGARSTAWGNRYTASTGTWGTPTLIDTTPDGGARFPQVTVNDSGEAVVVWQGFDGSRFNTWANRTSGGLWGSPELIEVDDIGSAYAPQVILDASGNALAVWHQNDGVFYNVWANRFNASAGSWGTATLIETESAGSANPPMLAADANGHAIAVWSQSDGVRNNVWANRFNATTGNWGTAELIELDDTTYAGQPQIAMNASGQALVVWAAGGTGTSILTNRFNPSTGTWGTPEPIVTTDRDSALRPQIALDSIGNALAVWDQSDGSYQNIWARYHTVSTGTWATAELIETNSGGQAIAAQVAMDGNGRGLAVWSQADGGTKTTWSNRYE